MSAVGSTSFPLADHAGFSTTMYVPPTSSPNMGFSTSNDTPHEGHLQATIQQIDQLANDVEMQPPPSEFAIYMVIDTNIVLHHYEALRTFVEDVEKLELPVIVVVPGTVIYELDNQKNRERLMWPARRASGWLLEKVKLHKSVKVQATDETCKPSRNWRSRESGDISIPDEMINDHRIIDCCEFFHRWHQKTIMCSADQNLCLIAQSGGLPVMTPPRSTVWTSRDIAYVLYGPHFPLLDRFSSGNAAVRTASSSQSPESSADSDIMMIDDETAVEETPDNVLHDDVRAYFTRLLLELAGEVGGAGLQRKTVDARSVSRHAAQWEKKHCSAWNAEDCLEYLYDQKPGLKKELGSRLPHLETFLSRRYTRPGARTGHEWSQEDWRVALDKLARLGECFGNSSLRETVRDLEKYLIDRR